MVFILNQLPHKKYKRRRTDLIAQQELTLEESLTGGKITIEHLNDKQITVKLKPGRILKPNDILVIDNLGMPNMEGEYGKLYLILDVKVPQVLPEDKLQLLLNVMKVIISRLLRAWIQR